MIPRTHTFLAFRLHFRSGLHISRGRPARDRGQETLHSDTLKSALYSALAHLGEDVDSGFLDSFQLTSAFPFVGEAEFLPLPFMGARPQAEEGSHKLLKRLRYIERSLFEQLAKGESITLDKDSLIDDGHLALPKRMKTNGQAFARSMRQQVTLRDAPDDPYGFATENTPTPYFMEEFHCARNAGLWFMVKALNEQVVTHIRTALRYLADEGLGSARSRGLGDFRWEEKEITLNLPANPTHHVALGLYCPEKEALTDAVLAGGAWELIRREGYIAAASSPSAGRLRRPSLHMMAVGTVFPGSAPAGVCHDLWPETDHGQTKPHAVWRDGRPLWLPINCPPIIPSSYA